MKKEKPILFSTPMIEALLAGRKTQTRRIRGKYLDQINESPGDWCLLSEQKDGKAQFEDMTTGKIMLVPFNYGEAGDELWVRETFRPLFDCKTGEIVSYHHKADITGFNEHQTSKGISYTWKPSIHMPRVASRIQLKVIDRGFERLQEISGQDAIAEGIEIVGTIKHPHHLGWAVFKDYQKTEGSKCPKLSPKLSFQSLWDSINGSNDKKTWKNNPWVEFVKFEIIKKQS